MTAKPTPAFFLKEFFFILSAVFTGIAMQMAWFSNDWNPILQSFREVVFSDKWMLRQMPLRLIVTPIVLTVFFYLLRAGLRALIRKNSSYLQNAELYFKYDTFTYFIFLLSGLSVFGIFLEPTVLFIGFVSAQLLLVYTRLAQPKDEGAPDKYLLLLFFISGFAALIYQVVWQRMLFQSFGVNIESVTIIVSIFMFGLGVGSLIGGYLSKKFPARQMLLFAVCEVAIGLFGLLSFYFIDYVTEKTLHRSAAEIAMATYALLFIPTALMGATLPILVSYLHKTVKSVGRSVSALYFVNTLGSAAASFATVHLLFYYLNLKLSLVVAALFNFAVVYLVLKKFSLVDHSFTPINPTHLHNSPATSKSNRFQLSLILFLSALIGYISLSQEILWMRLIGYATGGIATVFGNLLCFFLLGIAAGSLWAATICKKSSNLLKSIALILGAAAILYYLLMPALGLLSSLLGESAVAFMYLAVGLIAMLLGAIFPVLTHYMIRSHNEVGTSVSFIYFANVLGSTAGPIVTGFILLDQLSFTENVRLLSALTLISALGVFLISEKSLKQQALAVAGALTLTGFEVFLHTPLQSHLYEKLYYKEKYSQSPKFKKTIETRSGVINVASDESGADIILGGGKYDGHFNTDPVADQNSIARAYMLAALHRNPASVLEIGLSGGAWGTVISSYPKVKSLDIIEINSGYIDLVAHHSPYQELLIDPKVQIHLDDARRWLLRNPDKKFDVILMNTTYHWRSQISNLVSKEFLELCKAHLNPGGVFYYNATGSTDIPYTAAHVFNHVTRFRSFVAASDSPFTQSPAETKAQLALFAENDMLIAESDREKFLTAIENLSLSDLSDQREAILKTSFYSHLITDNNLASEFKTGKKVFVWERNWLQLLKSQ